MTEKDFWRMIEQANRVGDSIHNLGATLRALSAQDVVSFSDILGKKIADAGTFPVLAASFVIASYASDDTFRDFRAWLVSQGHDRYTAAIDDPETIADWLDEGDLEDIDGERMLLVAQNSFQAHGTDDEFQDLTTPIPDPDIEQDWPETKSEYRQRFPRLVDKYWNQRRIGELHSD